MADPIEEEIQKEVKAHKILIYGKGTKTMPMCGFTRETMQFFDKYGYPYELIDVLSQPTKREALTKMTKWPTLPKVFIDGTFYGDTDILDPMAAKGEIEPLSLLPEMAKIASSMVHDVLEAFVGRDPEKATAVCVRDDALDDFYESIFRTLLTFMMENSQNIGPSTTLLFVAKNLERIGDHATNIAEMVYYAATGDRLVEDEPEPSES